MHEHERLKLFNEARFAGNAAPEIYEFEAVRADGEQIWVQTSVRVVTWNGERATQHWLTDVTDRKLVEQRVARLASYDVSERAAPSNRASRIFWWKWVAVVTRSG